jgi:UDP-N-acetylmuramate--alanine ligase
VTESAPPGTGPAIDLSSARRLHVVGAGGAGMSAIAAVLAAMGHQTTGSDIKPSRSLERLRTSGVPVEIGHRPENVAGVDAVTISTAVSEDNVEVAEAHRRSIPVLSRAAILAAIVALRRTIAVAGTHGKTTTSSMLALVLVEAGLRPSFIIGGDVNEIGTNAAWDDGEWLIVEADESDGTFLQLAPELGIVTSVESDHLEYYGSFEALEAAFSVFFRSCGSTIVCADDPVARSLAPASALTYGCAEGATMRIVGVESGRNDLRFELLHSGESIGVFALPVPGVHNARNAAAAVLAAVRLGVGPEHARRALARFAGVSRRYEFRGEIGGVTFVDDYAHLPGEVRAAVAAARGGGFGRVVAVFQPHRYSRVATLAADFADAFEGADIFVITWVYAAGEAPRPGVSGRLVLDAVVRAHPETPAVYRASRGDLVAYLRSVLQPGDICLTLAAGDLTNLAAELGGEPPT